MKQHHDLERDIFGGSDSELSSDEDVEDEYIQERKAPEPKIRPREAKRRTEEDDEERRRAPKKRKRKVPVEINLDDLPPEQGACPSNDGSCVCSPRVLDFSEQTSS